MKLEPTKEQIAELFKKHPDAKFITVDSDGMFKKHREDRPVVEDEYWSGDFLGENIDGAIDNWEDLCFEKSEEESTPINIEITMPLKCNACGETINNVIVDFNELRNGNYSAFHTAPHTCKPQEQDELDATKEEKPECCEKCQAYRCERLEKPVDENCLFKPVLVRDKEGDEWVERILVGHGISIYNFYSVLEKKLNWFGGENTQRYYYAKRIPGYDYGDNT